MAGIPVRYVKKSTKVFKNVEWVLIRTGLIIRQVLTLILLFTPWLLYFGDYLCGITLRKIHSEGSNSYKELFKTN
ncbi:MAG: hypothetical protein CVT94_09890 [Bacteroidetes bacterium HGW-Bacteroidetes-11]|jgi:hypothetical protein|nr:MAG: hypothetical protein CVT94_09890 [Bacteroidetes bacterium HGW-Bacteroidetes-11]